MLILILLSGATVLIGGVSAFIVLCMDKYSLIELVQLKGPKFASRIFSCMLCLSFWVNLSLATILVISIGDWIYILTPLSSTAITRKLI